MAISSFQTLVATDPTAAQRVLPQALFCKGLGADNNWYAIEVDPATGLLPVNASVSFSNDTNYGVVGANTIRTAAQIGNATGAADFGVGVQGAQTLRVTIATNSIVNIRTLASGTDSVSAVQSGTWNINNISGTVSLPTGASTEATLSSAAATLTSIDSTLAGTLNVLVTNFPATQPVSGTVAVTQSTSPWVENVAQFGGSNVVTGVGNSGAGIPRVTVSSDSSITNISGTISLPTGASTAANQTTGNTSLASLDTKTLQQSFGPATQAASISVSVASDQPALPVSPTLTDVTYTAVGQVAFGSVTNAYTTVLTLAADTKILYVFNSLDQSVNLSLDSGANDAFVLEAGDSFSMDLGSDGLKLANGVLIQVKYTGAAPTSGKIRATAIG